MDKLLIPGMEILCASGFIAIFAYVIITVCSSIIDAIFTCLLYPYDVYTIKQLNEPRKPHHHILPRGGIHLNGFAGTIALIIFGAGLFVQIIDAIADSLP